MLSLQTQNPLPVRGYMPIHPESDEAIGRRLEAFRKAVGATQEELTELLGSDGNSLWANYEAGTRRIRVDRALILCREYHITLDFIYRNQRLSLPADLAEKIRFQELQAERTAKS